MSGDRAVSCSRNTFQINCVHAFFFTDLRLGAAFVAEKKKAGLNDKCSFIAIFTKDVVFFFSYFQKQCMDCLRYFCTECVIRRFDRILSCDNCSMLSRRPLIRSQVLQMRSKYLRQYLLAKKVSIRGCIGNLFIFYYRFHYKKFELFKFFHLFNVKPCFFLNFFFGPITFYKTFAIN